MKNVVLPLVLVITISLVFSLQDAYAVPLPNCTVDDGTIETLTINQLYVASKTGNFTKLQIGPAGNVDKGKFCVIGQFLVAGNAVPKKCTDIALDSSVPTPFPLYCVTFMADSSLYSVDRKTAVTTLIGPLLRDCDPNQVITQINTFEIDTGGLAYVGGFDGRFYNIDLATGCLTFRATLVDPFAGTPLNLSGDGAYELVSATMFVTAQNCSILHGVGDGPHAGHTDDCAPGDDGVYNINLLTFVTTYIGTTGQQNAFAMDILPFTGNLCIVTRGGTLAEITQTAAPVVTMTTVNTLDGSLLFANGGTALQQLVGGILVQINKFNLLLDLIFY